MPQTLLISLTFKFPLKHDSWPQLGNVTWGLTHRGAGQGLAWEPSCSYWAISGPRRERKVFHFPTPHPPAQVGEGGYGEKSNQLKLENLLHMSHVSLEFSKWTEACSRGGQVTGMSQPCSPHGDVGEEPMATPAGSACKPEAASALLGLLSTQKFMRGWARLERNLWSWRRIISDETEMSPSPRQHALIQLHAFLLSCLHWCVLRSSLPMASSSQLLGIVWDWHAA